MSNALSTLACPGRAMACMIFLPLLAACTTPQKPAVELSSEMSGEQSMEDEMALSESPTSIPGPAPSLFIGKSIAALEEVTGSPALTRREGPNEFRRYDKDACRIYAIVMPAGGKVARLSTGPALAGAETRSFEQCTAQVE
ncbi:MAG: hypothetical protein AAF603_05195 [Pseudomonadota bacterium]